MLGRPGCEALGVASILPRFVQTFRDNFSDFVGKITLSLTDRTPIHEGFRLTLPFHGILRWAEQRVAVRGLFANAEVGESSSRAGALSVRCSPQLGQRTSFRFSTSRQFSSRVVRPTSFLEHFFLEKAGDGLCRLARERWPQ